MAMKLITPASVSVVSLSEAKSHLNVDHSDDDVYIEMIVKSATDYAQKFTGRAFLTQTWDLVIDAFPEDGIFIPFPPLSQVLGVFYLNSDGDEVQLDTGMYEVDVYSEPGWIVPVSSGWPTPLDSINAVRVRFVAGWSTVNDIPSSIRAAVLLLTGTLYETRETVVIGQVPIKMPWSAEQLLRQYRVESSIA